MSEVERIQTLEYFAAVEAEARAEAERAAAEAARAEQARRSSGVTTSGGNGVWDSVARCESGGNWSMNSGNGFTGGLQFMTSTWLAQGGGKYAPAAYLATPGPADRDRRAHTRLRRVGPVACVLPQARAALNRLLPEGGSGSGRARLRRVRRAGPRRG